MFWAPETQVGPFCPILYYQNWRVSSSYKQMVFSIEVACLLAKPAFWVRFPGPGSILKISQFLWQNFRKIKVSKRFSWCKIFLTLVANRFTFNLKDHKVFKLKCPLIKDWQSIYSRVVQIGTPGSDRVNFVVFLHNLFTATHVCISMITEYFLLQKQEKC